MLSANRFAALTDSKVRRWIILLLLGLALLLVSLAAPTYAEAGSPPAQNCRTYHVVQRGETLHQIAQRYGTTWPVLAQVNQLPNPDRIYAGQRLCIPFTTGGPPMATVVNCYYLNVRNGPGVGYGVVEIISQGAHVQLLGRNSAATWANIRTASGRIGWVNASYLASNVPIGSLPVVGGMSLLPTGVSAAYDLSALAGPGVSYPVEYVLIQGHAVARYSA